jgi:hypothetical protein
MTAFEIVMAFGFGVLFHAVIVWGRKIVPIHRMEILVRSEEPSRIARQVKAAITAPSQRWEANVNGHGVPGTNRLAKHAQTN